ncbi:MAG: recombinase family protein [Ewingella americana]|uniref:recombinase family protein n=2 Tax=Ewingella americana TaxID=41202 RepID=UPI0024331017|nr:recombinase family protein [Ewingella americana]MCI1853758.1 recombinase family protein [Ewingella americana]
MMSRAISYLRFSNTIQQNGDSVRRQRNLINQWLDLHPQYDLDDTNYEDLGLSAFTGAHAERGAFGEFMEAVDLGLIEPGTVLLIESLDRLSRERIGEATERLRNILKAGIEVVTLCDGSHYTSSSLDDPYASIKAILIAQRANEESEIKSKRLKSAWERKREEAARTGRVMTSACPRWMKLNPQTREFELINERVKVIRAIFEYRVKGMSFNKITKILNDESTPTFKGKIKEWNPSTIEHLLSNKALIGTCVPSYASKLKGMKEIQNYYPPAMSEDVYNSVQDIKLSPFGKLSERDNPNLINIFRSIMKCSVCNHSMIVTTVAGDNPGYYVCPMRRLHRCYAPPIKRGLIDSVLIHQVLVFTTKFTKSGNSKSLVQQITARNSELNQQIENLIGALKMAPEVSMLAGKIKDLDKELRKNETTLRLLREKKRISIVDDINKLDLKDKADRETCQKYAFKIFKDISIDTSRKTCCILFINGLKFIDFPLYKTTRGESIVEALTYIDDGMLFF